MESGWVLLADYLQARRRLIDATLDRYLPSPAQEPRLIHECMRYSTVGGKRLRPIVALAVAELLGCSPEKLLPTCAAIEFIHSHSLILDDMPCMDNDDYRRGRPTSHRRYGEGVALLAADALLNLAITILGSNHRMADLKPETALEVIREVGEAVGTDGVIGGQLADLTFSHQPDGATKLERIHLAKTAGLFRLSARAAALVAGASPVAIAAVGSYGENLGLAFQIVDDILDHEEAARPPGKDGRREPSYVATCGRATARSLAVQATGNALEALSAFGGKAEMLRLLANYNLARDS